MVIKLFIFVFIFQSLSIVAQELPYKDFEDKTLIISLEIYYDSLRLRYKGHEESIPNLRITKHKNSVFVGIAPHVSWYEDNLPDKFSEFKDRYVLIYNKINRAPAHNLTYSGFLDFYKNLNLEIKHLSFIDHLDLNPTPPLVLTFKKGSLVTIKTIDRFPDRKFYSENLKFDKNWKLKYRDGYYHFNSLDFIEITYPLEKDFPFDEYIFNSTRLNWNDLRKLGLSVLVGFSKKGKVKKVEVESKCEIEKELALKIEEALKNSPGWIPFRVNGKPVKYKISFGF